MAEVGRDLRRSPCAGALLSLAGPQCHQAPAGSVEQAESEKWNPEGFQILGLKAVGLHPRKCVYSGTHHPARGKIWAHQPLSQPLGKQKKHKTGKPTPPRQREEAQSREWQTNALFTQQSPAPPPLSTRDSSAPPPVATAATWRRSAPPPHAPPPRAAVAGVTEASRPQDVGAELRGGGRGKRTRGDRDRVRVRGDRGQRGRGGRGRFRGPAGCGASGQGGRVGR